MLIYIVVLAVFLYFSFKWFNSFRYWKKRGIPYPPFSFIFGHYKEALLVKRCFCNVLEEIYKSYEGYNYVGLYKVNYPAVLIRDLDLAKTILFKEFKSFHDNDIYLDENTDLLGKNPFVLKGERWKFVRQQLTPYFTPKKIALEIINQNGKKLVEYIESLNQKDIHILGHEVLFLYTINNVAESGFGVQAHSFEEDKGEIISIFQSLFNVTSTGTFLSNFNLVMPRLTAFLGLRFISKKAMKKFYKYISDIMKYRIENGIVLDDYLNILMELKKKSLFTDDDIVGQSLTFFFDGTETVSLATGYVLYELAKNPEVQDKLRQEMEELTDKSGGVSYDSLQEMKYLDCVVNEALRLHTPAYVFNKVCTKPYDLPPLKTDGTGKKLTLEPGIVVIIPLRALYRDSKYFSDPDKFIPERHLNDAKEPIMAFGSGPRTCLGMRHAMLQIKMAIIHIVKNFNVRLSQKTVQPLELEPIPLLAVVKGGIWFNFEKRSFQR